MIKHDVLIVGGGLAGLRAAVGLAPHCDVAVVSRVHPVRSHSGAAQGGINAALGNAPDGRDDSPERHASDTIRGSDYLADQAAVRRMCDLAPVAKAGTWSTGWASGSWRGCLDSIHRIDRMKERGASCGFCRSSPVSRARD